MKKLFLKAGKFILSFIAAFILFLCVVAAVFGVNERRLVSGRSENHLPLTEAREWDPSAEPDMISRADFPGVKESRYHRYTDDPYLIFRNFKNYRGHLEMTYNDSIIFSVAADTDEYGRRCIDKSCKPQKSRCGQIGTFISSKIFGYGVNNDETVPANLKKELPNWAVYNYGIFTGHFIQFYLMLKSGELKKQLGDKPTLFLFFWEADGFDRTTPALSNSVVFNRAHFHKSDTTGYLEYDGNLAYYHPVKNYLTWFFASFNFFVDRFPQFTFFTESEMDEDFIQTQKSIKYEIEKQFPNSAYVLASIDYGEAAKSVAILHRLNEELKFPLVQIGVTDFIQKQKQAGVKVDFLPYDSHPTPVIYAEAARRLKEAIVPYLNKMPVPDQCKL